MGLDQPRRIEEFAVVVAVEEEEEEEEEEEGRGWNRS